MWGTRSWGVALLALAGSIQPAPAQDAFRDIGGVQVYWPVSAARGFQNGFGAWLVLTADPELQAAETAPLEAVPAIGSDNLVTVGGKLSIFAFLLAPGRAEDGAPALTCDVRVEGPDGSVMMDETGMDCLTPAAAAAETETGTESGAETGTGAGAGAGAGAAGGDATPVLVKSSVRLDFAAEAGDPPGMWQVRMVVRDTVKGASLELSDAFILLPGG